ncbi:MAG: hypothetical protein ACLS2Y_07085 [Mediterraneibacter faecis]
MNHLAVTSILTVVAHIIWFASMTERKYPIKKTVLLYGLYAIFFTLWTILAYSLLGKDSPYVIPFSFVGTILPAILLFLYTSSDSFSKKIFLIVTYANLFCIIICNGVQREHNKKLNNGLPILHKVPPKRDYGWYFCIMAEKGGTSHGGLTEKLSPFFHAKKQEVNAYGR